MKILVGMSGGVDSTVAALLLKRDGHDVTGVTMKIWKGERGGHTPKGNTCYGPNEDIERTKELCKTIGIRHVTIDCSEHYEKIVLDYFKKEYRSGRTPNPCIRCNQEVKFGVLPGLAKRAGLWFDRFATGHYARICFDTARNRWLLQRGIDEKKDQSYFLYRLSQEQLAAAFFPLGEMCKEEVRKIAGEAGLVVPDKEESQDFYSGNYADIIGGDNRPGAIVDSTGNVLGRHDGIWNYTVGQRKGLGIIHREPLYVLSIDADTNRVVVGTERQTGRSHFTVTDCVWIPFEEPAAEVFTAKIKVRSTAHDTE